MQTATAKICPLEEEIDVFFFLIVSKAFSKLILFLDPLVL